MNVLEVICAAAGVVASFIAVIKQKKEVDIELRKAKIDLQKSREECNLIKKFLDTKLSDCEVGPHCAYCVFGKKHTTYYGLLNYSSDVYLCEKHNTCEHFVEKEI